MNEQIKSYRQVDTVGKSQIDLIMQVYSGAIQSLAAGREHYGAGEFDAGYLQLERSRKFLTHLYTTLDFEQGGEVAQNLGKLYAFCMNEFDVIEATKEISRIDSCIKVLETLKQGWEQIRQDSRPAKAAPAEAASIESLLVTA
ncbi:MAG: flagellar protein FliS [candidate division Zixibacteria bacterium]|nr:flagellar protein FliS [candidate division Zixibacteria bacterium]